MLSARTTLIGFLLLWGNLGFACHPQNSPAKDPKIAIAEIEKTIAQSSRVPPSGRAEILRKIEAICNAVDWSSESNDRQTLEALTVLATYKVQSLRMGKKFDEARACIDLLLPKLEQCTDLQGASLAIMQSRLILLRQDVSFDDLDWSGLDDTLAKLKRHFGEIAKKPEDKAQLTNIAIQSVRYCAFAQRMSELDVSAVYFLRTISKVDSLSDREKSSLRGQLVDQVLDFLKSSKVEIAKWTLEADQTWNALKNEPDALSKSVAAELMAHRITMVSDEKIRKQRWQEYHEWLRRESFASLQDSRIGPQYAECNIQYLNQADDPTFASHMLAIQMFLDELQTANDAAPSVPTGLAAPNATMANLLREQIHRGIASRLAKVKRPGLMDAAPKLSFRHIESGEAGTLEHLRGKVVVLEFWNPSCGACLSGFPAMSEFYATYKERGLVVLGCTYAESKDNDALNDQVHDITWFRNFLKKHRTSYPMVLTDDAEVLQEYGITALPTFIVVDRQGRVVAYSEGLEAFQSNVYQRALKKALEQ